MIEPNIRFERDSRDVAAAAQLGVRPPGNCYPPTPHIGNLHKADHRPMTTIEMDSTHLAPLRASGIQEDLNVVQNQNSASRE